MLLFDIEMYMMKQVLQRPPLARGISGFRSLIPVRIDTRQGFSS
jgi:hypothetical protein